MTSRDSERLARAAAAAHDRIRAALGELDKLERTVGTDLDLRRGVDRVRAQLLVSLALLLPATKTVMVGQVRLPGTEVVNG